MTAREKLEALLSGTFMLVQNDTKRQFMAAVDACILAEHVKTCVEWSQKDVPVPSGMVSAVGYTEGMMPVRDKKCGDKWFCKDAPRRPE